MAKYLLRLSCVCILLLPITVLAYRNNLIDINTALLILAGTLVTSCFVVLAATLCSFKYRRNSSKGNASELAKQARLATYVCLVPIFTLATPIINGSKLPPIHNISTDTTDPPQFNRIASLRAESDNTLTYDPELLATIQQQAYPKVKTLYTSLNKIDAFAKALKLANNMGWKVINQNQEQGIIEAIETSFLWGFKDDIVIRVRTQSSTQGQQTLIDLRSVSRVGDSDLGANAKRIKGFIRGFHKN